jgi:hypothetical protein
MLLEHRRSRLTKIAGAEPAWKERFKDIDKMNLVEAEVWFWRYVNESIHDVGSDHPAYLKVLYEELASDPVKNARDIYDFCGIPWNRNDGLETTLHAGQANRPTQKGISSSLKTGWRTSLSIDDIRTVERVLHDSPMLGWWPAL